MYVRRVGNLIVEASRWTPFQGGAELADDDPELVAFLDPESTLGGLRVAAIGRINSAAEAARLRYLTPGAGQAATYLLKEADARRYALDTYPSAQLAQYPFVDAERQATGQTGRQAADFIIATADAWRAQAAEIEKARRGGIVAVQAAADVAAVGAARDAALTALAGL